MEHEYYMLKHKPGKFGHLKFKYKDEELYNALIHSNNILEMSVPVEFEFNIRMGGGATLGDYHDYPPDKVMVFSSRIIGLLQSMNISNLQFIPARIYKHKPKDTFSDDYSILHILKKIKCLDKEKSIWKAGFEGEVVGISSLVLDEKSLKNFPLNERLIFQLDEKPHIILFHKSIAEKINLLDPKGIYFYDLATFCSGTFYLHGFGSKFENP
ncbi:hypothetical protein AGMMS50293_31170 [Spirochaetia bacterium]|nr:hypothetical protein AGMMS50293_31170 [Spirochaetia bacterium]